MTPAVSPDLVADTLEALQARLDGADRDALRGTIAPSSPAPPIGA